MSTSTSNSPDTHPIVRYLWFMYGPSRFGLRLPEVAEVVTLEDYCALPQSDPGLVGFGAYHGEILPIFDPVALTGLAMPPARRPLTVAVARVHGRPLLGIALDRVGSMVDLDESQMEPTGGRIASAFRGQKSVDGDVLLILDPERFAETMGLAPSAKQDCAATPATAPAEAAA